MNLLEVFIQYIQTHKLFQPTDRLLLAVSGGVDSVVLCDLCARAGYSFTIAHCNFGLRGEESERDERFVRSLADKYNVPILVKKFDTRQYAHEHKIAIQEAARNLRYDWFYEVVNGANGEWSMVNREVQTNIHHSPFIIHILTAHHLDDNIETVLMNMFKGTGISGLRGILPKQGKIVRPLLFATKKRLEAYATEQQLPWVLDSSNTETKYTRNYFRHTIIPLIEKVYPQAVTNMQHTIEHFTEAEILYQQAINLHKKKLLQYKDAEVHIPVLKLLQAQPLRTVIFEIIKPYNFTSHQANEVLKLLHSESGRYITSTTHRILHNRKWLIITPLQTEESRTIIIEKDTEQIVFDNMLLQIQRYTDTIPAVTANPHIALIDAKEVHYPLILRKWRPGDYFYPLGMRKKKKLSRFFIDQKLSKNQKEDIWVIESHKKIIWIMGHRIDDRFKITDTTKKTIRFTISSL